MTEGTEKTVNENGVDPFGIFGMNPEEIASYEETSYTDWSKIFFEMEPIDAQKAHMALIKLLPNIYSPKNPILKKFYYKLPDPNGTGTFTFYSPSSVDKTCPVVEAWRQMKNSENPQLNAIAEKLKRTRQRCVVIQIINDLKNPELNGQFRLLRIQFDGDIDKLIKSKIKPDENEVKLGAKSEDVFNPFGSPILILKCAKGAYGRDFSGSRWAPEDKNQGMIIAGVNDGKPLTKELAADKEIQAKVIETLKQEHINIDEYFAYKEPSPETIAKVNKTLLMLGKGELKIDESGSNEEHSEAETKIDKPVEGAKENKSAAETKTADTSANAANKDSFLKDLDLESEATK